MSQASSSSSKKTVVAILSVVALAIIFWLSNKVAQHNGKPVIISPDVYREQAELGAHLAQDGVTNFNMGKEVTPDQKKNLEQAALIFDALDDYKTSESAGYFEAALCYYLIGDTDKALNRVQQSLNNAATSPTPGTERDRDNLKGVVGDCHHLLSLIDFDQKDYDKSIDESTAALKNRKDRPLYYVARARAEIEKSSHDQQVTGKMSAEDSDLVEQAKDDLDSALKIYPDFPPALQLQGLLKLH